MSVTAIAMDAACESSTHIMMPMAPNMCITPAAPSPLPMPYPLIGDTSKLDPACERTQIESKKSMSTKSKIAKVKGNEPGTQKDVVTFQTNGTAFAMMGAPTVFFEGGMVAFTGSPGFANTT